MRCAPPMRIVSKFWGHKGACHGVHLASCSQCSVESPVIDDAVLTHFEPPPACTLHADDVRHPLQLYMHRCGESRTRESGGS